MRMRAIETPGPAARTVTRVGGRSGLPASDVDPGLVSAPGGQERRGRLEPAMCSTTSEVPRTVTHDGLGCDISLASADNLTFAGSTNCLTRSRPLGRTRLRAGTDSSQPSSRPFGLGSAS